MATFGDIKTRIASELVRDDLAIGGENEGAVENHIRAAIRLYGKRNFWFIRTVSSSATTTASQNYITRPTTIERITRVSIPALGWDLDREDLECIEESDEPTAQTGQPVVYAEKGATLRLWPTPNDTFTVKIVGTSLLTELAEDTDTNAWTTYAEDLLVGHAKMSLCRSILRDPEGARLALGEAQDALNALNEQNIDRLGGPVKAGW